MKKALLLLLLPLIAVAVPYKGQTPQDPIFAEILFCNNTECLDDQFEYMETVLMAKFCPNPPNTCIQPYNLYFEIHMQYNDGSGIDYLFQNLAVNNDINQMIFRWIGESNGGQVQCNDMVAHMCNSLPDDNPLHRENCGDGPDY